MNGILRIVILLYIEFATHDYELHALTTAFSESETRHYAPLTSRRRPRQEEEDEEEVGVKSTKADSPPVDKMADMKKKLSVMSTASRSLPPPLTPRRLRSLMLPEETLEEEEQPSSRLSSRLSSQRSSPLPAADFQLPGFITDCIGKEWFDSYFPDCNEQVRASGAIWCAQAVAYRIRPNWRTFASSSSSCYVITLFWKMITLFCETMSLF